MRLTTFKKIHTSDRDLDLLQSQLKTTLDGLTNVPMVGGNLVGPVTLPSGTTQVSHGLGRNYVAAFPCLSSAAASLSLGTSIDPTKYVAVTASAPTTLYLWVI